MAMLAFLAVASAVTVAFFSSGDVDGVKAAGARIYFDAFALCAAGTGLLFARMCSAAGGSITIAVAEIVLLPFLFLKLAVAAAVLLTLGIEAEADLYSDFSTLFVLIFLLITLLAADGARKDSGTVGSVSAVLHFVSFSVAVFCFFSYPIDGEKGDAVRFKDLDLYLLFIAGVELLFTRLWIEDARRPCAAVPSNPVV